MSQSVSPLPVHGDVIIGRDAVGKVLRVSRHAELDRVVLSIWEGPRCVSTLRLAAADVPDLIRVLAETLVDDSRPRLAVVADPPPAPGPDRQAWPAARAAARRLHHRLTGRT